MAFSNTSVFNVENGTVTIGGVELNDGGTVKVSYNFLSELAEIDSYGSFPDKIILGMGRTITGTIEYWAGADDTSTEHISPLDVGNSVSMVHTIPNKFKFDGTILLESISEDYDASSSEPVKSVINFKVSGTPTLTFGTSVGS